MHKQEKFSHEDFKDFTKNKAKGDRIIRVKHHRRARAITPAQTATAVPGASREY